MGVNNPENPNPETPPAPAPAQDAQAAAQDAQAAARQAEQARDDVLHFQRYATRQLGELRRTLKKFKLPTPEP